MALTSKQTELLKGIQSRLQRGDITDIAATVGMTREHVSRALNINGDHYNEKIIEAAMTIITNREATVEKHLEALNSD